MYQTKKVGIMYVVVLIICLSSMFTLPQLDALQPKEKCEKQTQKSSQTRVQNFLPACVEEVSREKPTKANFITTIFGKTTFEIGDIRFEDLLNRFFRFIFAIVGIYLVLTLAVRGVQLIYAGLVGKPTGIQILKGKVVSIFVSLVILLLSYLILSTVNPDLVNLNLGIPSGGVKLEVKVKKTEMVQYTVKSSAQNAGCPEKEIAYNPANNKFFCKVALVVGCPPSNIYYDENAKQYFCRR